MASAQQNPEEELAALKAKIDQLQTQIAAQTQKETETLELLDAIDRKVNLTKNYVARLKSEIRSQNKKIKSLEKQLDQLDARLALVRAALARRLVSFYKYGRISTLEMLLGAQSLHQVQVWAEYQRRLSAADALRIETIQAELEKIRQTRAELAAALVREQKLLAEKNEEEKQLQNDRQVRQRLLAQIRKEKSTYQKQLDDYRQAVREIQRLIAQAERETQAAEATGETAFQPGIPFAALQGRLPWPAEGKVIRAYGPYQHPVLKTVTENLGIDLQVEAGTAVHAVADGKVTAVTWQRGRGNLIIINHSDGYYTVYTHLDDILVNLQQTVSAGEIVGTVGDTGSLEGPLLHFQIWNKFNHLDPEEWLQKR